MPPGDRGRASAPGSTPGPGGRQCWSRALMQRCLLVDEDPAWAGIGEDNEAAHAPLPSAGPVASKNAVVGRSLGMM